MPAVQCALVFFIVDHASMFVKESQIQLPLMMVTSYWNLQATANGNDDEGFWNPIEAETVTEWQAVGGKNSFCRHSYTFEFSLTFLLSTVNVRLSS